ncbi:hypothetical protein HYH03_013647 [Edaphochlamys debaryana]|uniref:PPIase cyclophilin-type domain-containing protein n=1 Tax=Edaphochlamys debaryana TaxID=47281 RepID=A0A835XPG4_9CHLO|nr:hypothetical protein HYH03_013647 [Edaphochlamys debaryana]|eukprot:KAG2487803.1 hypothetical protein HYH03_013647 [Edaphochlamys debaryana]
MWSCRRQSLLQRLLSLLASAILLTGGHEALATEGPEVKDDPALPLVWLEVAVNGTALGRMEVLLLEREAPLAAENFRLLCTGELGKNAKGQLRHFKGSYFYRIVDDFIDQTGAEADGAFDEPFRCDPGGLELKHTHKGLLSMAHTGPNTNGGHFSIMMGPAHHLDGKHVIFGQIIKGMEIAEAVNRLAKTAPDGRLKWSKMAQITDAGQIRRGSWHLTKHFKEAIAAEKNRIAWRNKQPREELGRLRQLYDDQSLPMVYFDIALNGTFIGRIDMVLFVREAPLAAESFRLMCSGEEGLVPQGKQGAGKPYSYKGMHFYRIIHNFIDQGGMGLPSPLGGEHRDDPGGLRLNHSRMGLLSIANAQASHNTNHFSIMMSPQPHLNGKMVVFGEIVDGHNVALEMNAITLGRPKRECVDCKEAQVIACGQYRRGSAWDEQRVQETIRAERERLKKGEPLPGIWG